MKTGILTIAMMMTLGLTAKANQQTPLICKLMTGEKNYDLELNVQGGFYSSDEDPKSPLYDSRYRLGVDNAGTIHGSRLILKDKVTENEAYAVATDPIKDIGVELQQDLPGAANYVVVTCTSK